MRDSIPPASTRNESTVGAPLARAARRCWMVAAALFASAFCYALYYHGEFRPTTPILATAGGLVFSLFALRMPAALRVRTALFCGGLAVALYAAEITVYLTLVRPSTRLAVARANGVPFDTRTASQVCDDLRAHGSAAVVVPDLKYFRQQGLHPLSGVADRLTLIGNESGQFTFFESDEHGFNNPNGLHDAGVDAVLVGDSFALGYAVQPGEDVASRLRESGITTVCLGTSSNGPLLELASLREYATSLRPRWVLWMYYEGNDFDNLRNEAESPVLQRYLDPDFSQRLKSRQAEVDRAVLEYLDRQSRQSYQFMNTLAGQLLRLQYLRRLVSAGSQPPPPPLFRKILERAKEMTSAWGGELIFVYLPTWNRYAEVVDQPTSCHRREVLGLLAELEISIVDIHSVFERHPDPLALFPMRIFGHYTAEGYRLTAEAIRAAVRRRR